jgi:hypothetical protein
LTFLILHALSVFFQNWVAFMAFRALPVIEIDRNVIFGILLELLSKYFPRFWQLAFSI